ncbi:MAG: major facilitator superfamily 1 [Aeromicrobium sp.]|uniref:MDR family MFS transporter n=1 Tax=Aeromicrobium sp. TaxID=1871063 RepID=UPI002614DD41|nr:MDR family MFS transporter [Aeromicrobium sp.]MCW2789164.1 major facilitator superfamily 1 [Aeromicrobium sp.]MCW2826270.1 major facilitator superfamily 1 [Aeromicrobium sp.]
MTASTPTRSSVGLRSERGPVLLGVMLSVGLVAIDATILATAVPSVVEDLGGFAQFPWLFSVYLLAQAISVPLYGKFADIVGRKPIMLIGIALFLLGSILCGVAWSMLSLIVFRAVQGLGAGAVLPMSMTIIGDLYSVEERSKVQGYVASVWGASSVIGPTLGGVFSDHLSWRWIFFVNIPIGLAAAAMLVRRFHEDVTRTRHTIDYAGALLLATGGSLLILGLLEGGVEWAWDSTASIGVLVAAAVLLVGFVLVERRAAEPILPLWIFRRRVLIGANASSLVVGVLLIGLTSYVPLYAQGVLGTDALVAGFAVAAMTLGWPLAAALAGRFYLTIGFRDTAFMGSAFVVAGAAVLLTVGRDSSVLHLAAGCFVVGIGLGFIASPVLVAAQSSVDWTTRGVVTGTNMFGRSVGSALGIAVFGAIANAAVTRRVGADHPDLEHLSAAVLAPSIHQVYVGAAVAAVVMIAAVAIIPRRIATTD